MAAFTPIIRSLLDTDLYKFTMWQVFLHAYPSNHAVYHFFCRNQPAHPLSDLKADVEAQLDHLCSLSFTAAELDYLATLRYLKPDFLEFLRIFHFQRRFISVDAQDETLRITAAGPQIHSAGFEIYVLSIVNELYFRRFDQAAATTAGRRKLADKIALLREFGARSTPGRSRRHPYQFFEFGTRRRFSRLWQHEVVTTLQREVPEYFKGTSNVALARESGLVPMGTMAHEYLQTFQAVGIQLRHFQKAALEAWVQEYRGDLGIALTDVVGMDAFLRDFDLYFAKLFDGQRHDSGDPFEWGEKALAHYHKLRIDPHTKRFVFSDALDFPRSFALHEHFSDRVRCGFGIGTYLTNDVGITPLNIVMKLAECNGQPVAKLSDTPSKTLCNDATFLAYLRQVFHHPA